MSSTETLPLSGSGSFRWFESVFNHKAELNRVLGGLDKGFNPKTVLDWFQREVTTFLTERAVGQTALTIQPPTRYLIETAAGKPSVIELHVSEFGDLAGNFLTYDQTEIPEIAIGLDKTFNLLPKLNPGAGLVIFSPAANYKKAGSTSDVINIFTVEGHIDGKTEVTSHFLFLNRELTREQRDYWLTLHNPDGDPQSSHPREILAHPQLVGVKPDGLPLSPEEYIDWMNMAFIDRFGEPLFDKPQDEIMARHIDRKVASKIHHLYDILLHQGDNSLYLALWALVEKGQKQWAELNHFNPQAYWEEILLGHRQLSLGFHPTDGSNLSNYWDSFANDWIGGTKDNCGEKPSVSSHCEIHGEYDKNHSSCPKCNHKSID